MSILLGPSYVPPSNPPSYILTHLCPSLLPNLCHFPPYHIFSGENKFELGKLNQNFCREITNSGELEYYSFYHCLRHFSSLIYFRNSKESFNLNFFVQGSLFIKKKILLGLRFLLLFFNLLLCYICDMFFVGNENSQHTHCNMCLWPAQSLFSL